MKAVSAVSIWKIPLKVLHVLQILCLDQVLIVFTFACSCEGWESCRSEMEVNVSRCKSYTLMDISANRTNTSLVNTLL